MAYKPQSEEEKEILAAYDGVKDAIIQVCTIDLHGSLGHYGCCVEAQKESYMSLHSFGRGTRPCCGHVVNNWESRTRVSSVEDSLTRLM